MVMKISEVTKSDGSLTRAYRVSVDGEPVFTAPTGLEEVGFLIEGKPNGQLPLDVIDTAIAFRMAGVHVLLELLFDCDSMPPYERPGAPQTLLTSVANLEMGLSILPPDQGDRDEITLEVYREQLCKFMIAWLESSNDAAVVHPVTGFYQYLVGEELGYKPDQVARDPYIKATFFDDFLEEHLDYLKEDLRKTVYEFYGGQEGFREYVMSITAAAAQKAHGMAVDINSQTAASG